MSDVEKKTVIATNVNEWEPNLYNFIGQEKTIFLLRSAIEQYFNDKIENRNPSLPVILLTGEAGTGRRTIARCVHNAVGNLVFKEVGSLLGVGEDLVDFFENSNEHTTYYIVNAFQASPYITSCLIRIIRDKMFYPSAFPPAPAKAVKFNGKLIILGSNRNPKISDQLLKQINIRGDLTDYTTEQLFHILYQRVKALGWSASETSLKLITDNSRGNPGQAMKLLQYCYVISRASDKDKISIAEAQKAVFLVS